MSKNNGGPAFPAMHFDLADNERGMTLRDYFAAQALVGLFSGLQTTSASRAKELIDGVGIAAYRAADAMLKAREE